MKKKMRIRRKCTTEKKTMEIREEEGTEEGRNTIKDKGTNVRKTTTTKMKMRKTRKRKRRPSARLVMAAADYITAAQIGRRRLAGV